MVPLRMIMRQVLLDDIVTDGVSRLQTQLRHREGHEARRSGLEAIPLDEHIDGMKRLTASIRRLQKSTDPPHERLIDEKS